MAKKVVAKQREGKKHYALVIRSVKSEKSGEYVFKEDMVPDEMVKEVLAKKD